MWTNEFEAESDGSHGAKFFEPLAVDAPPSARPHCCYLDTVIFYKQPYESNEKGGYADFGQVETQWNLLGQRWTDADLGWRALAPLVQHEGHVFELTGGRVIRRNEKWWMEWSARRLLLDDFRLTSAKGHHG